MENNKVIEFETKLSELIDNKNIVTFSNTHSALYLFLYHLIQVKIINKEDEVLIAPLTTMSIINPIILHKLKIKWVDISAIGLMDMNDLLRKLTYNTKIIIISHYGGYPINYETIDSIKEECYKLFKFIPIIIEDCTNAFGTKKIEKFFDDNKKPIYKSTYISSQNTNNICLLDFKYGNIGATNILDEGGVLTFPNEISTLNVSYIITNLNILKNNEFRMSLNPLNAISLINNLDNVNIHINKQIENAKAIEFNIRDNTTLLPLRSMFEGCSYSSFYLYFNHKNKNIADFVSFMKDRNIIIETIKRNDKIYDISRFQCILPGLDILIKHIVIIPCGWQLDIKHIIKCLKEFIKWVDEPQEEIID